eukprot:CAMPEP_0206245252 /NCGR_PEP_ID=MMETSP0047_2-20121206/18596_1 /ASSEMBLY_ACC=CAM_ASM_000192 /TAXON_ID=195065 /ORGANISM="Chroomonas mesostigmatica_cf, Strain CCMP1168" /LENGTH=75 /DNA_ID=CAMNT_0053670535 /DNA_START=189 /DNA_END=413 /DNA_ORIENTATION=+
MACSSLLASLMMCTCAREMMTPAEKNLTGSSTEVLQGHPYESTHPTPDATKVSTMATMCTCTAAGSSTAISCIAA